jgi:phosphatidylserine/phosphatidylglycerophosphate/cardiolipin synthase-like enzyme
VDDVEVHFAPTGEARLLERELARILSAARDELCVAVYAFTSFPLARTLEECARDGVRVRVLVDAEGIDAGLIGRLRAAGVQVRRVFPEAGRFHHKFAVRDARIVATGSYNWTVAGDVANHENVLVLDRPATARRYREVFERTWNNGTLSRP